MAETTGIEWADATWNPWYGCTKVSPGCDNCYAQVWAKRAGKIFNKVRRAAQSGFTAPIRWKQPRRIFVCSLSDFFHPDVPPLARESAIQIMTVEASQHIYMLLTKRPENIKQMLRGTPWQERLPDNIWLGVTAENQEQAKKRIPLLLEIPAKVRFVSCEPLLGPVNIFGFNSPTWGQIPPSSLLNWVICGGESGYDARPMHPAYALSLRDQCAAAGVPFFFKQWGQFLSYKHELTEDLAKEMGAFKQDGVWFTRCDKQLAGCLLEGREYKELPL